MAVTARTGGSAAGGILKPIGIGRGSTIALTIVMSSILVVADDATDAITIFLDLKKSWILLPVALVIVKTPTIVLKTAIKLYRGPAGSPVAKA